MTCEDPGTAATQCGAGITKGYTLNFKIVWASGSPSLDQTFNAEISDWASIGIVFAHSTETFNAVIKDCSGGAGYELCSWGGGWVYAPDYYPSGETLFAPSRRIQRRHLLRPAHDPAHQGDHVRHRQLLTDYATYAAQQLPVLYKPQAITPAEVKDAVKSSIGFAANPLGNFMPEYYSF